MDGLVKLLEIAGIEITELEKDIEMEVSRRQEAEQELKMLHEDYEHLKRDFKCMREENKMLRERLSGIIKLPDEEFEAVVKDVVPF